eukprot:194837_1
MTLSNLLGVFLLVSLTFESDAVGGRAGAVASAFMSRQGPQKRRRENPIRGSNPQRSTPRLLRQLQINPSNNTRSDNKTTHNSNITNTHVIAIDGYSADDSAGSLSDAEGNRLEPDARQSISQHLQTLEQEKTLFGWKDYLKPVMYMIFVVGFFTGAFMLKMHS